LWAGFSVGAGICRHMKYLSFTVSIGRRDHSCLNHRTNEVILQRIAYLKRLDFSVEY